ncbi:MAG: hypothetical protein CMP23_17630 [Rickettsiales bacterium]|nr:hypothetical protein [Rickettsiales bacterium]
MSSNSTTKPPPPPRFLAEHIRPEGAPPEDSQVTEKTPIPWGRVFRYLLPYWRAEVILLIAMSAGIALSLVYPLLMREIVDGVIGPGLVGGGDSGRLMPLVGAIFAATALGIALSAGAGWLQTWVTAQVLVDLRLETFRHLQSLGPLFLARRRLGDILSRMGGDLAELQQVATGTLLGVIGSVITLIAVITALSVLQPILLAVGAAFIPLALIMLALLRPIIRRLSLRVRERNADISHHMLESLSGLRSLLAHGLADREANRFRAHNMALVKVVLRYQLWNSGSSGAFQILVTSNLLAVLVVGVSLLEAGQMSAGDLLAFLLFQQRVYGPLQGLAGTYIGLQRASASAARVFEILDTQPLNRDAQGTRIAPQPLNCSIDFDGIRFSYAPGRLVLDQLSFTHPAGSTTAIVGPSGAGKSTIIDLLFRFADPDCGQIRIDGIDLKALSLETVLPHIALVSQEPILFDGSLRDNLRWLVPESQDTALHPLISEVGLDDFVASLPDGLETRIGDRGVRLSVGQKQRIGLARALLRNPVLLVLDEVTSSLDWESDLLVTECIRRRHNKGQGALIISHRLQLAAIADQVLVLGSQGIEERGKHAELLAAEGLYARLWRLQRGDQATPQPGTNGTPT